MDMDYKTWAGELKNSPNYGDSLVSLVIVGSLSLGFRV